MNWGDGLLALLGVCAFSLLWARKWNLNAALLPLPAVTDAQEPASQKKAVVPMVDKAPHKRPCLDA